MEKFTVEKTNLCKGVAILIMLFHHLFFRPESWPLYFYKIKLGSTPLIGYIASQGKICVSIFVFLSAYGLTLSVRKKNKQGGGKHIAERYASFVISHIKKLYMLYWPVFILAMLAGIVFRVSNPFDIYCSFGEWIKDFLGVEYIFDGKTPFNSEWWYISFAITLYAIFPVLYSFMRRFPKSTLVISFLVGIKPVSSIMILMEWKRYLFVSCLGIYFAENDLFSEMIFKKNKSSRIMLSILCCFVFFGIRIAHPFTFDGILVIAVIVLSTSMIEHGSVTCNTLVSLGKYSGTMYVLHGLLYRNFARGFIYGFKYPLFIYLALVILTYSISAFVDQAKSCTFKMINMKI